MKRYLLVAAAASVFVLAGAAVDKTARETVNSIGLTMVRIAPGSFEMGAGSEPLPETILSAAGGVMSKRPSQGDFDETPAHKVTITKSFRISQTEVTIDQFRMFKPDYKGNPEHAPSASGVSWNDAVGFCQWLSHKEGKNYRLPTEAEWEYACRAGTKTPFYSGNTAPAPGAPNAWGLKNMESGVAEWCFDWYGLYPSTPQTDPVGMAGGIARVVRGAGLDYRKAAVNGNKLYPAELPYFERSSNRASEAPVFSSPEGNIGFRVVEAPMPKTQPLPVTPTFFSTDVKQTAPELTAGPDPTKPYYHVRRMFPYLGDRPMATVGRQIGMAPGLGITYHNSAVQVCPNGDLVAAYYDSPRNENDPDQTVLSMRMRYGTDEWDNPEPWPDFADAADAAPVYWNDHGRMWLFFGSPRLVGAPPFQYMTSMDNGATWSAVVMPNLLGPVGDYTPQPINSVVRTSTGAIFLPVDGKGGSSVLFTTTDDGKTWHDSGGRTGGRHTTLVIGKDGSLMGFGGKNTNIDGFMPKSISTDGGKTYVKSKTPFLPLGSGQRPSIIRLASGRLFFVADNHNRPTKREIPGAFVALSDDDGVTWQKRALPPEITSVGYVTATQGPNGIIHIVTSKTRPHEINIDLNEAWVREGGPEVPTPDTVSEVKSYRENYPNGSARVTWSGGVAPDGRFLLQGEQTFYYPNGRKQWESSYKAGKKTGTETFWNTRGQKEWDREYQNDGTYSWRIFDPAGHITAESRWKGKDLVEVLPPQGAAGEK
ncbi:MAG TPA: SUMF1/EgtB/PvdO family nonheme iron enzyme [Bryobacteraceae bacterium]|nr:SUMF1/EgtB/PvdO family nonheme iron enzyme [Bryobacteraceae bacterium]